MECLHCGKKISALHKLQDEEFCSAAHRKAYKKKQEELAVDFLRQSKPRRAKPEAQTPQPPAATPMEPQPILVLADLKPESVAYCRVDHAPQRNAEWTGILLELILPAGGAHPAPSLCDPGFAGVGIRPQVIAAQLRLAQKTAVAFERREPMVLSVAAQLIWIEPAQQARVQRPAAEFRNIRPAWVRAGEQQATGPVAVRFSAVPALAGGDTAPRPIVLRLAQARPMAIAAGAKPDVAQEGCAHTWQSCGKTMSLPAFTVALGVPRIVTAGLLTVAGASFRTCATAPVVRVGWRVSAETLCKPDTVLAPRVHGVTACESVGAAVPRPRKFAAATANGLQRSWRFTSDVLQQPAIAMTPAVRGFTVSEPIAIATPCVRDYVTVAAAAIARHSIEPVPESPLLGRLCLEFRAPALRSSPPVKTKRLLHKPASIPVARAALSLVWNVQVRVGRDARVIPQRPRFEEPLTITPRPSVSHEVPISLRARMEAYWFAAPSWSRQVVVIVLLAIAALSGFRHLKSSGSMQKANHEFMARLRDRATVDIQDDFRGGLSQWTGAPGWANSWTYDPTGFARPGRLALLASSRPLSDYRLEFLAEIDKKAVAWAFRAVDARNYYAYKLMESKRGTGTVFSIVRYAMVGGHERLRIQLPLPVTSVTKTMLRVRQEIRGDQFTTYLDGRVIDTWSDAALASGGFGFFADPGETAYIRWVDVAYQDDTLGRICAYLVPAKHD